MDLFVPLLTLLVGFAVGLTIFKVKSRWCPKCGLATTDRMTDPNPGRHHHV